ncbi:MAG: hypothetical protein P8O16_12830 [Algoriphagus sp.]|uniref:hypothetical protein n=1 Tax=Algoriphagus sp. TaxID=1872435 RepID=UPI002602B76E|nr:hypothetical protein [Algoriphagus sp.]MDG1278159.1 hypothetical protein [Algoriphagus sp.]
MISVCGDTNRGGGFEGDPIALISVFEYKNLVYENKPLIPFVRTRTVAKNKRINHGSFRQDMNVAEG